ncbi:hypothetical protein Hanom_Chr14g01258351 [Helianthus anomalus]
MTLIVKRPRAMKHMPLMKIEQDFQNEFRWWEYDPETGEVIIVLKTECLWGAIRILDPMWLVNLSEKDVGRLYYNKIVHQVQDVVQAMQYQNVIKIRYTYEINSGKMWNTKWPEIEKKEFMREIRKEERIEARMKKAFIRRYQFMTKVLPTNQTSLAYFELKRQRIRKYFFRR